MSGNVPAPGEKNPERIAEGVRDLFAGRSNAVGRFTLAVSPATQTVVAAMNCGEQSFPFFVALTANAAAAWAAGMHVSDVSPGSFTIEHAASADADREFAYVCLG